MIAYCLLIWVGLVAGMPAGYFVACGFGMMIKILNAATKALDKS